MNIQQLLEKDWLALVKSNEYFLLPLLLITLILQLLWLSRSKLNLPPGPIGLPIIGYLPFLGNEPFKTLDEMKKKYGNVISMYLGRTLVIILGDSSAVEEALSKTTTLDRPQGTFAFLPDSIGFGSSNGEEWSEQRRFALRTMRDLGLGRSNWSSLVEDELIDFIKEIESKKGQPIDIAEFLTPSITNNICSLVFGRRLPAGHVLDRLNTAMDTTMQFFSQAGFYNYFPWFSKALAKLGAGSYSEALKEMVFFNSFMKKEAENHRKSKNTSTENDFVNQYLQAMEKNKTKGSKTTYNDKNLIGGMQAMFLGGSDTTRTSLVWLFLGMASYPDVQKKIQSELDSVLGKDQHMAQWEDRAKFPYTYAAIMEGQRWKTLVPLNTARTATENITLGGYDVPKGATIIANFWALHNDPKYWKDSDKFIPERFLKNDGKEVNLKPESYTPFSYGKRKCPGETVALMEIFLYFTAMMKMFHVRTPHGGQPKMDAILGITYQPLPQELCFLSRS